MKNQFRVKSDIVPLNCVVDVHTVNQDQSVWILQGTIDHSKGTVAIFESLDQVKTFLKDNLVPEGERSYKIYLPYLEIGYDSEVQRLKDTFDLDLSETHVDFDNLSIFEIPFYL